MRGLMTVISAIALAFVMLCYQNCLQQDSEFDVQKLIDGQEGRAPDSVDLGGGNTGSFDGKLQPGVYNLKDFNQTCVQNNGAETNIRAQVIVVEGDQTTFSTGCRNENPQFIDVEESLIHSGDKLMLSHAQNLDLLQHNFAVFERADETPTVGPSQGDIYGTCIAEVGTNLELFPGHSLVVKNGSEKTLVGFQIDFVYGQNDVDNAYAKYTMQLPDGSLEIVEDVIEDIRVRKDYSFVGMDDFVEGFTFGYEYGEWGGVAFLQLATDDFEFYGDSYHACQLNQSLFDSIGSE